MAQETTFSVGAIAQAIIVPLRYYFSTYSSAANFIWNEDEKLRTMDIFESQDLTRIALGEKPRVVVTRGSFGVSGTGLSNNLSGGVSFGAQKGNRSDTNMVMYQGQAQVLIEARTKGACELLADMVTHFVGWTQPLLCDTQGWKQFGLPMQVSDCMIVAGEEPNVVKFQVQINLPWLKEERWLTRTDAPELKKLLTTVVNGNIPT
jgi:hypothetical protein